MKFISPKREDNYLVACERCESIISFSKADCFCRKTVDMEAFSRGDIRNVSRVYIECPNCKFHQDVAGGFQYLINDKNWF